MGSNHKDSVQVTSLHSQERTRGKRLLCLRFSAIGDVAMTVPVVKAFALTHPDVHIIMVSRPFAKAFYEGLADNVEFVGMDLKRSRYKGILGAEFVYHDLKALKPDMVADLHDVLRTKYARLRFRMAGIPVAHINKYRQGRKELTRQEDKLLIQQPTSFEKYKAVFDELFQMENGEWKMENLPSPVIDCMSLISKSQSETSNSPFSTLHSPFSTLHSPFSSLHSSLSIGIAPFAAHEGKIYPIEKMERVIIDLKAAYPELNILLFGGGKRDKEVFDRWCQKYNNTFFASEKCKDMREELAVMQQLRCMISMDSGNMHLASLVGTPVISIWGATHPCAGFMGWKQIEYDTVQVNLPCRPCSIYGNKPCLRGDFACMNMITPHDIVKKVERYLIINK